MLNIEFLAKEVRGSNKKSAEKTCKVCQKVFFVVPHRATKAKFCSPKCRWHEFVERKGIPFTCVVCGKEGKRSPHTFKAENPTCSPKCRGALYLTNFSRKFRTSPKSWFERRGLLNQCERCGYNEIKKILVIHHKDRNHRNNDHSNLECLCPNCHSIEHLYDRQIDWHQRALDQHNSGFFSDQSAIEHGRKIQIGGQNG